MNNATIKENKKARKFLKKAARLPINLASMEKVIMPTSVRVDIKAAT